MRRFTVLVSVLAMAVGPGCSRGPVAEEAAADGGRAEVTRVVDGDTIRVRLGGTEERVRLIGIDTPETHGRGGLRECFGEEASRHLSKLLPPGTAVRLVRDVEARDRYDRLLAYVYRHGDGLFVNLALARDGYATVLTYPPNVAHAPELVEAVRSARMAQRGLWRRCGSADVPINASRAASTPR